MSDHHLTKAEKKQALLKKNLKNRLIFLHVSRVIADSKTLEAPEFSALSRGKSSGAKPEVWSARLNMIRNKVTGQREMAKERWNRFAATGDAGGRGL